MNDLIAIGRSGVLAYRDALAGVSENVVNANDDGFGRRSVRLNEQIATPGPMLLARNGASFNGVQSATVTRVWDQFRAASAWTANSDSSFASTRSQWLSTLETTLDDGASGIGTKLTTIFTTGNQLAATPDDVTLRQTMLYAIDDAASTISQTGANLAKVAASVAQKAATLIDQTNNALNTLAKVNISLKTSPVGSSGRAALEDQRDLLVGTISGNLGVDVTIEADGEAGLKLNDHGGPALLSAGSTSPAILGMATLADGSIKLNVTIGATRDPTSATSGAISALVDVSVTTADRRRQIDTLASDLTTSLNDWQNQGRTAAGVAGPPLLMGTTAATIKLVDPPPVAADIAAADTGTPGAVGPPLVAAIPSTPNGNLLALKALRDDTGVEANWRAIVSDQALQVSSANTQASTASTQRDNAYAALDETSGVDLDSEAADLMRFQQAYSASAKIIQTARETIQDILNLF